MSTNKLFMPITGEEKRALLSLCLIAAKQTGFIPQETTDLHDDRLLQLYRQWGGDNWAAKSFKPMGVELKTEEAAQNFADFCKTKAGENAQRLEQVKIEMSGLTVSMHVPLGQRGMMVFTASGIPPHDPDDEQTKDFYSVLMQKVILGYEEYINHPPKLPVKKSYYAKDGDTVKTFAFTSIISRSEGSKRGYFVRGGAFSKYGVRVWPNILSAAGIDPETIDGEKFIAGTAVYTSKANGDPDLVTGMTVGVNNL